MIEGLTINQTTESFEYYTKGEYIDIEGECIPLEKLEVRKIIETAIQYWNLNNPKLPIRCSFEDEPDKTIK